MGIRIKLMEVADLSKKMAILASNGEIFDAYKVFNIASAAAAMETEVSIFFTFDAVNLIHKEMYNNLPKPEGREGIDEALDKGNVPAIPDLVEMAKELGVKLMVCQMTMDLYSLKQEDLVDGVEPAGAVTFIDLALDADVTFSF